jgi:hypothetical protein
MTVERIKSNPYFVVAIFITVANVALIWAFRFLPLYDYPVWLYEVRIMRALSDPLFSSTYEIVRAPVPNLGFVGPIWLLSFLMPLEVAGKVFLTVCVIGLPWSFLYSVRAVSSTVNSWAEYFGFPFSFSLYFFSGQAFLFGLTIMLLGIGFFLPRIETGRLHHWLFVSLILLLLYFVHAIALLLTVVVIVGAILASETKVRSSIRFLLAAIPTAMCLSVYFLSFSPPESVAPEWSFWTLAQNVFKSLFLFTRSHGQPNVLPLTLLNAAWLIGVMYIVAKAYLDASRDAMLDKRFVIPSVVAFGLILVLPGNFLGVVQPGARFALPLMFFLVLLTSRAKNKPGVKTTLLVVASVVMFYNAFHFDRIDKQMKSLYADLEATIETREPFCVVRFDWPADRNVWDVGATSIDPLFGAAYYVEIQQEGVGAIFGTSLLRGRGNYKHYKPLFDGKTREEFTVSIIRGKERFDHFRYLIMVGRNREKEQFAEVMTGSGFTQKSQNEFWTILEANSNRAGPTE